MSPVLVYVHDLRSSGVVRNALAIAARIAVDRPTMLVAGYADGLFLGEAREGPFALRALIDGPPPARGARAGAVRPLRALIARERPALLLSAGSFGHATVWRACAGRRRPPRVYLMSNEVGRTGRLSSFAKTLFARVLVADAARVTLVSPTVAASPAFAAALRTGRAALIPNGVDLVAARAGAAAPSPHPWLDEAVPVVLGIGRLHAQKNFALLIEAVATVRRTRRVRLAILGTGTAEARAMLSAQAGAAGFGDDFLLAGETGNVFAWAARGAVFALPSRWEGSSLALLEAMAVGVPVVATRQAGDAVQVLDEGRYGLLADAGDAPGFAAALARQLGPDRVLPGERAEQFSLEAMLARYAVLVAEIAPIG